jgi:hypothetical protein
MIYKIFLIRNIFLNKLNTIIHITINIDINNHILIVFYLPSWY